MPLYFLQPGGSDRGSNCNFCVDWAGRDRVRHTSKRMRLGTGDDNGARLRTRRAVPRTIAMMSKRAQTKG